MQHVSNLVTIKHTTSRTPAGSKLADDEKALVNLVFARLKTIFGGKYDQAFKTESDVVFAKREWARDILKFSRAELDKGLAAVKESDIGWPDLKAILKLCREQRETSYSPAWYQLPPPRKVDRAKGRAGAAQLKAIMAVQQ